MNTCLKTFLQPIRSSQILGIGLLLIAIITPASAGLLDGRLDNGGFLPVDEAFIPYAELRNGEVIARVEVTRDYYLYKDRFAFALAEAGDATLGDPVYPPAKEKEDPYFGKVNVYDERVEISIPVNGQMPAVAYLDLSFQGCADAGLCYPPETRRLPLLSSSVSDVVKPQETATKKSAQDRLKATIESGSFGIVILVFAGLGLLLAFTPCILPTLPILSGLVVGQGENASTTRSFFLSLTYALSMAATLALLGLAAGTLGASLQGWTQQPSVLIGLAVLVAIMALSMFGLFEIQLPSGLQTRISSIGSSRAGSLLGALFMGACSTAIVSACAFPAIVAALLVLGESGDRVLGTVAMFSLGVGMGLPLVIFGTLGGTLLPKAGEWMESLKRLFGFILLATAVWLLGRLIDASWTLILWGILALGAGATMGALERHDANASWGKRLGKAGALMLLIYGLILIVGGFRGATDPFKPLHPSVTVDSFQTTSTGIPEVEFIRIKTYADLEMQLKSSDKPVMLDYYADWCTACKEMEHKVFPKPEVASRLAQMTLLQTDVTDMDQDDRELMSHLGVIGPPTMIFYDKKGLEHTDLRLIGELNAEDFANHLQQFLDQVKNQP